MDVLKTKLWELQQNALFKKEYLLFKCGFREYQIMAEHECKCKDTITYRDYDK